MTRETPKKKSRFLRVLLVFILLVVLAGGTLYTKRNALAEHLLLKQLHAAGFPEARLEQISFYLNSTEIHGLTLSDSIQIKYLKANYTLSADMAQPVYVDLIQLDKLTYKEEPSADTGTVSPAKHIRDITALALPIKKISLKNGRVHLLPRAFAPKSLGIKNTSVHFKNDKKQIDIKGKFSSETDEHKLKASFETQFYDSGDADASISIEKAYTNFAMLGTKRVSGWTELSLKDDQIQLKSAEISVGAGHLYGIPLHGVTLTYHNDKTQTLLMRGKSPGDIAQFSLDASMLTHDDDTITVQSKLDLTAKHIEKLHALGAEHLKDFSEFTVFDTLKDMTGSADIRLDFTGRKSAKALTEDVTQWNEFTGAFSAALQGLTLPPYMHNTNIKVQSSLSPSKNGIQLQPKLFEATGQDKSKTKFRAKIQSADTVRILFKPNWDSAVFDIPKIALSYGSLARYNGNLKGDVTWAPHLKFHARAEKSELSLPDSGANVSIQNAEFHSDEKKDILLKGKTKSIITLKDSDVVPVHANISGSYSTSDRLVFDITAQDKDAHATAIIKGEMNAKTHKGHADVHVLPIFFSPAGAQPHHFMPSLKGQLKDTIGEIGFKTRIKLPTQKSGGVVLVKNLSAIYEDRALENINAAIAIQQFHPLKIKKQTIAMQSFNPGIPFHNGLVRFSYDASKKDALFIHDASWKVANGDMSFKDLPLSLNRPQASFEIDINNLSLQQLLALAPLDGLSATGTVSGMLPIKIDGKDLFIQNGTIETDKPGTIRYAPKDLPAFLQDAGNQNIVFLRQALNNFHYQKLGFTINGKTGADQEISLKAEGRNPDLETTRPIILNLNLQGALENILQHHVQAYKIPDTIHEQIRKYEEQQ